MPLRLSYIENAFINRTSLQGRLKEFTQAGVEFLGDGSPDADGEILALTIQCLLACGLEEFQLEVGHVGFLKGLFDEARLSPETEETIRSFLENKNFFGMEEEISRSGAAGSVQELFGRLPELFGSMEQIRAAEKLTKSSAAQEAIRRLSRVYEILCFYGLEKYVSFDLGMVGHYRYYDGMIFKGYTYGFGEPVVTGGRYNKLMEQFGKKAEAVGFAIGLDAVMAALDRQNRETVYEWPQILLLYEEGRQQEAVANACRLREQEKNVCVQRMVSGSEKEWREQAVLQGFERLLFLRADGLTEVAL